MMQRFLFFTVFMVFCHYNFAQKDDIIGTWLTNDKEAHVEIYKSDGIYYGKIIWLKHPINPKTGKPWLDEQNKNVSKKQRAIVGSLMLWGFKLHESEYRDGYVYDSRDGSIYSAKLWLDENKTLKMRGYWGMFYKTESWTKVKL